MIKKNITLIEDIQIKLFNDRISNVYCLNMVHFFKGGEMNVHAIILFDDIMEQAMTDFSKLSVLKTAVHTDSTAHLSEDIKRITDLYIDCFTNFGWLPKDVAFFKRNHFGKYDSFCELSANDPVIAKILDYLPLEEITDIGQLVPFHIRFTVLPDFYTVNGLIWSDNSKDIYLSFGICSIPRDMITIPAGRFAYVSDLFKEYDELSGQLLRDWLKEKKLSYNKIQKASKMHWGDTFYSYYIKVKMIMAIHQILFTTETLKQIAISHKFVKYSNMYRTFKKNHIDLTEIPRFAKH